MATATADAPRRASSWILVVWLLLIVSGAATTGLLRAPVAETRVVPLLFASHRVGGTAIGLVALVVLLGGSRRRRGWGAALVAAAVVWGWLAARSFVPMTVAIHASLASFVTLALLRPTTAQSIDERRTPAPDPGPSLAAWPLAWARVAVVAVLLQIAIGALLRHQLIGLAWHLLAGGVAALVVLTPAVAVAQDPSRGAFERRAARRAVAAVLVQASLGASVVMLIMVGTPRTELWLGTTVAHVVGGSLTLIAVAVFERELHARREPDPHS